MFGWEFSGLGFGVNFLNPYNGAEFVFNGNNVAFQASITDPDGPGSLQGVWVERPRVGTPTGLELVARTGADTDFTPTDRLGISALGEVMFITNVNPDDNDAFNAIATYNADIRLHRAVGLGGGRRHDLYKFLRVARLQQHRQGAFVAGFNDLPDSNTGIFKSNDPNGIIATEGIVANGTPDLSGDGVPDFVFNNFSGGSEPLLNGNGNVVFWAQASTNDNSLSISGLWSDRHRQPHYPRPRRAHRLASTGSRAGHVV